MKDQYFGDVNDYCKYGLLRLLGPRAGLSVGVCWMLTPADARSDGRMIGYLSDPARWRHHDPELYDQLHRAVVRDGRRSTRLAATRGLIPGARFFRARVPGHPAGRRRFLRRMLTRGRACDLLFFDPDNGMEVRSVAPGQRHAPKYLYWPELRAAFGAGHSVLVYQHLPRRPREMLLREIAQRFRWQVRPHDLWIFLTPRVAFVLVTQRRHARRLTGAVAAIRQCWQGPLRVLSTGELEAG